MLVLYSRVCSLIHGHAWRSFRVARAVDCLGGPRSGGLTKSCPKFAPLCSCNVQKSSSHHALIFSKQLHIAG